MEDGWRMKGGKEGRRDEWIDLKERRDGGKEGMNESEGKERKVRNRRGREQRLVKDNEKCREREREGKRKKEGDRQAEMEGGRKETKTKK